MKIAAAEAQWNTCQPCSFSLFQIGGGRNDETPTQVIEIPHLLSILATGTWNGQVVGLNELQSQYEQQYGQGNYVPNVFIQYWSMRVMAYLGCVVLLVAAWGGWLIHRHKLRGSRRFLWAATWLVAAPFLMNTAGWFLTESGRQPWIVQGLMTTANGVSPSVSTTAIWISLLLFIVALRDPRRRRRHPHVPLRPPGPRGGGGSGAATAGPDGDGERPRARRGAHVLGVRDGPADLLVLVIAVFWTGFFVLEGFDLGVGTLHVVVGKTDLERRVAINTIGPFWDGNEVWLIVAGAGTFAAFPDWYATWFSAGYLALMLVLVALIVRGVSFEFRNKVDTHRWKHSWSRDPDRGQRGPAGAVRHRHRRPPRGTADRQRRRVHRHRSGTCSRPTGSGSASRCSA